MSFDFYFDILSSIGPAARRRAAAKRKKLKHLGKSKSTDTEDEENEAEEDDGEGESLKCMVFFLFLFGCCCCVRYFLNYLFSVLCVPFLFHWFSVVLFLSGVSFAFMVCFSSNLCWLSGKCGSLIIQTLFSLVWFPYENLYYKYVLILILFILLIGCMGSVSSPAVYFRSFLLILRYFFLVNFVLCDLCRYVPVFSALNVLK